MKRKFLIIVVLATLSVIAINIWVLAPLRRERSHIRERVEMMRQALRRNDLAGVAELLTVQARADYRNAQGLAWVSVHVHTDDSIPSVSIRGEKASVAPHLKYYFGLIPHGNTVEMIKENGEWYFTGKVSID